MNLWSAIFGCTHGNTTFPQSRRNGHGVYVVCLDCGKEFAYDLSRMCIVPERKLKVVQQRKSAVEGGDR